YELGDGGPSLPPGGWVAGRASREATALQIAAASAETYAGQARAGNTRTRSPSPILGLSRTSRPVDFAILHVALEPKSGVWSVIRDLSQAQITSGRYRGVAMGV